MEEYIIKEEDLIGCLEGVPVQIVYRMLEHQVNQGSGRDITIFQRNLDTPKRYGGFNWSETKLQGEGSLFWARIINHKDYRGFFSQYPIITESTNQSVEQINEIQEIEDETIKIGDIIIATNSNEISLKNCQRRRIYMGELPNSEYPYLGITQDALDKLKQGKAADISSYSRIQKVTKNTEYIELTLKDISEGKGIGINPNLIKIVKK